MNKNIIITGTSRGIGFDLARLFANAGHQVLALSRNTKAIQDLASKNIKFMTFDLCDLEDYNRVDEFYARFSLLFQDYHLPKVLGLKESLFEVYNV